MFKIRLSCKGLTDRAEANHGKPSAPLKPSCECDRRSRITNPNAGGPMNLASMYRPYNVQASVGHPISHLP